MLKYILFFFLISFYLYGQELNNEFFIKPKVKFGVMVCWLTSWEFTTAYSSEENDDYHSVNPNLYFGIGIETKDFEFVENSSLNFNLEISYGSSNTKEVFLADSRADFQIKSIPILFWVKLKSSGIISPYVQLGIGAEKSVWEELYYDIPKYGFKVEDWFFCYGLGAGIYFNYFEKFNISVFVDVLTKENGFIIELSNPEERAISFDSRNSTTNCGLEFAYKF